MNIAKLRDMTDDELAKTELDLDQQLLKLRFQLGTKQVENPMKIREVKRSIAKIKTLQGERRREKGTA